MYTRPEDDTTSSPTDPARPRRMTVYQTREGRPRWVLHMQAVFWRVLMGLGMFFHKLALPRPPKPDFYREIPSTISGTPAKITLYFYVPRDYETQRRLWINRPELDDEGGGGRLDGVGDDGLRQAESSEDSLGKITSGASRQNRRASIAGNVGRSLRRLSAGARSWGGYPVVINFHGGGFTLGRADDDARWCGTVVDECHAVVVSVDYRLAPEHPFPTAVEDGVDALLYIHEHADELGIDKDKIALSGFSSGANMAFTVPLRLYDEMTGFPRDEAPAKPPTPRHATERAFHGAAPDATIVEESTSSSSKPTAAHAEPEFVDHANTSPATPSKPNRASITSIHDLNSVRIRMLISWYPPVDYTRTRAQRRATSARKDQELPAIFTDLFDESYLHPPHTISLDSPYLSPGVAPTALLRDALPTEILLNTCEWDMLLDEGRAFYERLISEEIGKKVTYKMMEGTAHGFDKAPSPFRPTPGVREHYLRVTKEMRRVFGMEKGATRPVVERSTTQGYPTAAPRGSIQVVR